MATNNGDIGKAAKHLTTSEAFKAMGFAMATAGLSETGLGRTAAGFTVDVAMGKKIDEAALNAARVAVVSTLQATAAKYIGAGGLDPVTRGMMHGFTGAAAGAALGKDAKEGAISGAIAAVAATTVANFIKEDPNIIGERAVAKARADGSPLDKASLQPYIRAELRGMIDISRLSGAIATLFAGYDVTIGIDVATTAVINNCAATMERQVFESSALKKVLQEAAEVAKTTAADAMDKTADFVEENPERAERAAEAFMGAAEFMAEDRVGKAPKIRTKGQAKADKVLRKGIAAGLKSLPKHLRAAADKVRGGGTIAKPPIGRVVPKVPKTNALPKGLKSYVREVESKSGLKVHPKQQEMLAKDLREMGIGSWISPLMMLTKSFIHQPRGIVDQ